MLIDWFTVSAQALNFVILLWLMKRFLYQPVLDAIDAREQQIAARLADADAKQAEAATQRDDLKRRSDAFDAERAALLVKATADAATEGARLLDVSKKSADAAAAGQATALAAEAARLAVAVGRRTQTEVFAIARKALTDLSSATLEARIAALFVERLAAMDDRTRAGLIAALKTAGSPAIVRSAFDLPEAERTTIQQAVDQAVGSPVTLRFETAPDRIAGIELATEGQKLCWNIADYLTSLEATVGQLAPRVAA